MKEAFLKLCASCGISTAICVTENTQPLITAAITFGVSLLSVVGGELIKLLVAYLKNKRAKYENIDISREKITSNDDKKDGESNG